MREYAKIYPQFWVGKTGKQIVKSGAEATVVALYLLSSPHSNMLGIYYIPLLFISHETGLSPQGASKGLRRCIEAGFCDYDDETEMVFVFEMARFQIDSSLKENDNRVKGINREYQTLPKCPFLYDFYKIYKDKFHINKARGFEGALKGLRSQEQEQEQEMNDTASGNENNGSGVDVYKSKKGKVLKGECLEDFKKFWKTFAYAKGKAEAADAWLSVYSQEIIQKIIDGAEREAALRPGLVKKGATPKMAQGWLSGRRWEDEVVSLGGKKVCDNCDYKVIQKLNCWQEGRKECQSYRPI